jgi:hypothetical protein
MPALATKLEDVRHAYQVLGIAHDASAHSIKQAYRRLIKRWHPDLATPGTTAHNESTQMTLLINEAYAKIANAPLRYRGAGNYQPKAANDVPNPSYKATPQYQTQSQQETLRDEDLPNIARIEFWVRFVCGFLFGLLMSFVFLVELALHSSDHASFFLVVCAAIPFAFAFGSARFGDRFWLVFFRDSDRHLWF